MKIIAKEAFERLKGSINVTSYITPEELKAIDDKLAASDTSMLEDKKAQVDVPQTEVVEKAEVQKDKTVNK
jgi:hypothetical protein